MMGNDSITVIMENNEKQLEPFDGNSCDDSSVNEVVIGG